jgi:hypothetical protein
MSARRIKVIVALRRREEERRFGYRDARYVEHRRRDDHGRRDRRSY